MANVKQAAGKRLKMAQRAQAQMDILFPEMPAALVWSRKNNDGFTTLPRTLPIAMQAIDMQTKGQPAGHTLFCLWARSPDHSLITIENAPTFAGEAGFIGERAVDTWRRRMKRLRDLGFIKTKPGTSGEFHYVLLMNPNAAMEALQKAGKLQEGIYSRFVERVIDVGALGDVEAIREHWEDERRAAEAEAKKASRTAKTVQAKAPKASKK